MGLAAVVPCPGRIGGLGVPFDNSEVRVSALNHEPVNGVGGYPSADFTTKFAYRRHSFPIVKPATGLSVDGGSPGCAT